MATIDLDALKDDFAAVGKELVTSGVLTPDERRKVGEWTVALGVAYAQGDPIAAGNYRTALSTMIGVAELRAAAASEKAALRLANLALGALVKVGLAALV